MFDTFTFYFTVTIYDEDNGKDYTETGYTIGTSYSNALQTITEYYGEDNIISVSVSFVTDKPILILPTDEAINQKGLVNAIKDNNNI